MSVKIIEHHPHYDFEALFREAASRYTGVDTNDFDNLFRNCAEIHSFIAEAAGPDRAARCIYAVEGAVVSVAPMDKCSRLLLYLQSAPEGEAPFLMSEAEAVNSFIGRMPSGCEVVWDYGSDSSLGGKIRIIALAAMD